MPWWGRSSDTSSKAASNEASKEAPKETTQDAAAFDPNRLPNREKLPQSLQKIVDKADHEDNFYDEIVSG